MNKSEQIESTCLVDAAISFCKLQHLDPSVTIKSQVVFVSFELESDHLFFLELCYLCPSKTLKCYIHPYTSVLADHLH